MKQIELLSPAKDLECGIAAINCGADAVYIGASIFGARVVAGNNLEDIEKLISYAHKYRAKVYVTVNTILNNKEIIEAQKLIKKLYEIGADAIIIQDMGLLELDLSPIPLFASTQCHNNSWQKVEFLEKVGFNRVILARELSLEQIKEIKSKTNIDLEFFVHGALCVSYSGQCYMSYAIGGRSGNRGECAQPCRKLYSFEDSSGKVISKAQHLLSLKDLNLSCRIKGLIDVGITSFKIEGRLKDANYIKNIVSFYRQKIDEAIENTDFRKSSSGKSFIDFSPNSDKTFNRGYTEYFISGRSKDITAFKTPKFLGEPVEKVIEVKNNNFVIDTKVKLNNGDGICYFDNDKLQGTTVNKAEGKRIFPNEIGQIKKGTFIYRNLDHEFVKKLNNVQIERKVGIKIKFYEKNNKLILIVIDEDKIEAVEEIENSYEQARNKEAAIESYKKQFAKLGETEFYASEVEINIEKPYFIPVKDLNKARRRAIEKLVQNRHANYKIQESSIEKNDFPYPEKKLNFETNILNDYAKAFYNRHGAEIIEYAAESGLKMQGRKVMTTKHCLRYQFDMCRKHNSGKNEPLYLVDEHGKKYLLNFDCKNCQMEIVF